MSLIHLYQFSVTYDSVIQGVDVHRVNTIIWLKSLATRLLNKISSHSFPPGCALLPHFPPIYCNYFAQSLHIVKLFRVPEWIQPEDHWLLASCRQEESAQQVHHRLPLLVPLWLVSSPCPVWRRWWWMLLLVTILSFLCFQSGGPVRSLNIIRRFQKKKNTRKQSLTDSLSYDVRLYPWLKGSTPWILLSFKLFSTSSFFTRWIPILLNSTVSTPLARVTEHTPLMQLDPFF